MRRNAPKIIEAADREQMIEKLNICSRPRAVFPFEWHGGMREGEEAKEGKRRGENAQISAHYRVGGNTT